MGGLDPSISLKQMPAVNFMMSHLSKAANAEIPDEMKAEHAAQNLEYVFTDLAEEQDRATKNQFKVFQFCHGVKNGTFDFDMV